VIFASLSPESLAHGEEERRSLLNQISVAIETNEFPGYGASIEQVVLPTWYLNKQDSAFAFLGGE
jgi:hypothetical protein